MGSGIPPITQVIGHVAELVRYPVKSMAGTRTDSARLGWHGLDGDRRFAFRKVGDNGGFPFLTASRVPQMLLYHPLGRDESTGEPLPTGVRTPAGAELGLRGGELRDEIAGRFGDDVELLMFKHGIFDEGAVSVIATTTIASVCETAGTAADPRRFRANIVVETPDARPFMEDEWVGGRLVFGDGDTAPALSVTARDVRCMMINLDPDTAAQDAGMMKAVVRLNDNHAGVYGTVVRAGPLRVGDPVWRSHDAA